MSIRQPWIDLILRGIKTIEVRDWKPRRTGPILLHSSSNIDWQAVELFGYSQPWSLARGGLVGYAEIKETFEFTLESWHQQACQHWVIRALGGGDFGLRLENVKSFQQIVVCPGRLFFFPVSAPLIEKVRERSGLEMFTGQRIS